jgi:vinculin
MPEPPQSQTMELQGSDVEFSCEIIRTLVFQVSREVGAREKELTHQVHREILVRCLDQVKTLAPILICSMKIFIHIISQG